MLNPRKKFIGARWPFLAFLAGSILLANWNSLIEWRNQYRRHKDISIINNISFIAHAGGREATAPAQPNTLAALEDSYKRGHRLFEIDLSWTSDDFLVGIHDWEISWEKLGGNSGERPKIDDPNARDLMTLKDACQWRSRNANSRLITDVKQRNIDALFMIKNICGTKGIIPQVHNESDYSLAKQLGFHSVILTLYRAHKHPNYSWEYFIDDHLVGITIPVNFLNLYEFSRIPRRTCLMTHTINQQETVDKLSSQGVCGFYTDTLNPSWQ